MKITFEIDTDKEGADLCELEQLKAAKDMAAALWDLQEFVLDFYRHPNDNKPLDADVLHDIFYDILTRYGISLDKVWR